MKSGGTLSEAKRLYELGFAIHWLKPRSKAPLKSKWTSGERADWKELEKEFRPSYNVGVRLGSASQVSGGFLAAVDFDLKSSDPKHLREMQAKLATLFSDCLGTVQVASGRGNGSGHLYVWTPKPIKARRLAQSSEHVPVKMSVKPSNTDRKYLTEDQIKAGFRNRPAWEICLMGEGQQVALPPSIHPDSGKPYAWTIAPSNSKSFFLLARKFDDAKNISGDKKVIEPFELLDVDLALTDLPASIIKILETGEDEDGNVDLSALAFKASIAMVKAGLSDREIVSVLVDRDRFSLAEVGFKRRGDSVDAAADWVREYCVRKARLDHDISLDFDKNVQVTSEEEIRIQNADSLAREVEWLDDLQRNKEGTPRNTLQNLLLIFRNDPGTALFRLNEFVGREEYASTGPWGGKIGAELGDRDIILMKEYISRSYRFEPTSDKINEAIVKIAHENRYHPVRDYFKGLPEWDGIARAGQIFTKYMNAKGPEDYLGAVSIKMLVAAVKRVFEPGCKYDQLVVLEGGQGIGKSTSIRHLTGDDWFSDAGLNLNDKDGVIGIQGVWIQEIGEMSSLRKAEVDQTKEFMSRQVDRIRVPYGRRTESFPRQCIFIGTTNSEEYLKDLTGNRRFWPVKVGACDFGGIARDRDQIWAEALIAYDLGETLYMDDEVIARLAIEEQENRLMSDIWLDQISDFLAEKNDQFDVDQFTTGELFSDFGPLAGEKASMADQKRAGDILRKLGYEKIRPQVGGIRKKCWAKSAAPVAPVVPPYEGVQGGTKT